MLVLSRKANEEIVIAGEIRVRVLEVHGNRVRIGIEAPRDVTILRDELIDAGEADVDAGSGTGSTGRAVTV